MNRLIYKVSIAVFLTTLIFGCCNKQSEQPSSLVQYVDPYIGTDYHGHVFLGAHVPFGMVQTGPTNYTWGWDWCSGYHYSDSILTGFSQTHLSGTGIGDLGDILITPFTGEVKSTPGSQKNPLGGYASLYKHDKEKAEAGYYSVELLRYNILAELTATERTAFHKYTFPENEQSHIAINLARGIGWDRPGQSSITVVNDTTIIGYRKSNGWAKDQILFFAVQSSKPFSQTQLFDGKRTVEGTSAIKDSITAVLTFQTKANEEVLLKVGVSPVSTENALNNIEKENEGWNFNNVVAQAKDKWNKELSKIVVESADEAQLRTFYTAVYHAYTAPVLFNDANGDYRGTDKEVYKNAEFNNYTVFSLWDTYRAAQPLYTLSQPERVSDMINSMLAIYQQQGKLPIWPLHGNETDCMVGFPAIPVVADAIFKGFPGIDKSLALEAMQASSMRDDYGVKHLKEKGFIPAELEKESVSKALEYAIADWCTAQLATSLNESEVADYYNTRAQAYQKYFDKEKQFMRAIMEDGNFRTPFNPFESTHEWGDYTEGNAWQYTWLVPHDVKGLINLFGSDEAFTAKLDSLFIVEGDMGHMASPDISGLIGMYAQGNEPGHHIPYLYSYAGQQWKTAKLVRRIMDEMFTDQPDGICGNEDCGQMSAWYILSSMGLYQVNPANGVFVFGSPLFDKATITLPDNKSFTIKAVNQSKENVYIQKATLNRIELNETFITYKEIMNGGELIFEMGNTPNMEYGKNTEDRPYSQLIR
ncbi:GH92 family glycosyl hydrolase [Carboxylicivirga caseinilyticus]|uniref:GH92 family glycosyl hydrolase n=1 Tax=Carboxylicivirga caseinilyticus TaxID=3417572 RepID=UPI003D32C7DB|nr:GH92 family glycosyl hydrolase [Marinilabiliaceae bacterium A049]